MSNPLYLLILRGNPIPAAIAANLLDHTSKAFGAGELTSLGARDGPASGNGGGFELSAGVCGRERREGARHRGGG